MTIDDFKSTVKKNQKAREQIRADIEKLMQRESQLDAEAQAAVENGDSDLYIEKLTEKDKTTSAVYVKRSFLDRQRHLATREDAMSAWADYSAKHEKALKKLLNEYNSYKEKMYKLYAEMVELQDKACATRENTAAAAGIESAKDELPMEYIPLVSINSKAEPIAIMPNCDGIGDIDAVFYAGQYGKKHGGPGVLKAESRRLYAILVDHNPFGESYKWEEVK